MALDDQPTDQNLRDLITDATIVMDGESLPQEETRLRASLIVLSGWEIGREIEIHGQSQVLGRSNLATTQINAPSVSRQHARIDLVKDAGGDHFTLTDLGSSNGTRVNTALASTVELKNGDRIQMGDVLFKFALQDAVESQFHQRVHQLIHYDQLTGLLTMEAFRQRLDNHIRQAEKDTAFCLAMTDLDGLKRVNDSYGHLAGRMIVREMGVMMRGAIRQQDMAGLYGGDEGIVFYRNARLEEAALIAEELRTIIEARQFEHHGHHFGVTISQGIAEYPTHGKTAEALISAADAALYKAKAEGRNRVVLAVRKS